MGQSLQRKVKEFMEVQEFLGTERKLSNSSQVLQT